MNPSDTAFQGYTENALAGMRRMLSRLDRRPWSPTFGCFDRDYWHYKTLTEFPRADFQQALWGLALLYRWNDPANEFAHHAAVRQWIAGGLTFWAAMRHSDGSLSEWYANERSFCATAFTAAGVAEILLLMGDDLAEDRRRHLISELEKSIHWLAGHTGSAMEAANQLVAALLAAHGAYRLTGKECCHRAYEDLKHKALSMQHAEGWFSEHHGADTGYGFLVLDYLALLCERTKDKDCLAAGHRLIEFLNTFVHPGGVFGGDLNQRATGHYFPYGIEFFARHGNHSAQRIAALLRTLIAKHRVSSPPSADDTYAAYFYLTSYCLAASEGHSQPLAGDATSVAGAGPAYLELPGAGLYVIRHPKYTAVINTRKGVWQAFDTQGNAFGDAGYILQVSGEKVFSSQPDVPGGRFSVTQEASSLVLTVEKKFGQMDIGLPLQRWVVPFKAMTRWVLRFPFAAHAVGRWIRLKKIWKVQPANLFILREWRFTTERILITDRIRPLKDWTVKQLFLAQEGAGVHNPSSQLYSSVSLARKETGHALLSAPMRLAQEKSLERTYDFSGAKGSGGDFPGSLFMDGS